MKNLPPYLYIDTIYKSGFSTETDENSISKVSGFLSDKPEVLLFMATLWIDQMLHNYLLSKGASLDAKDLDLAQLIPDMFAERFRVAIIGLKWTEPKLFIEVREWLKTTHPEQLEDSEIMERQFSDQDNKNP